MIKKPQHKISDKEQEEIDNLMKIPIKDIYVKEPGALFTSWIWKQGTTKFLDNTKYPDIKYIYSICTICEANDINRWIKIYDQSPSNIIKHIKSQHKEIYNKYNTSIEAKEKQQKQKDDKAENKNKPGDLFQNEEGMKPLKEVDSLAFQSLTKLIDPTIKTIPTRNTISRCIFKIYDIVKQQITNEVKQILNTNIIKGQISIMLDGWSSSTQKYQGIKISYIKYEHNLCLQEYYMGLLPSNGGKAVDINKDVIETFQKFQFTDTQIQQITDNSIFISDGATPNIKFFQDNQYTNIICFNHILNNAMKTTLEEEETDFQPIYESCRKLATFLRGSVERMEQLSQYFDEVEEKKAKDYYPKFLEKKEKLEKQLEELNNQKKPTNFLSIQKHENQKAEIQKKIQENVIYQKKTFLHIPGYQQTRWNCSFFIIKALLVDQDAIEYYSTKNSQVKKLNLAEDEWKNLDQCFQLLSLIQQISDISQSHSSKASLIPTFYQKIKKFTKKKYSNKVLQQLCDIFYTKFSSRYDKFYKTKVNINNQQLQIKEWLNLQQFLNPQLVEKLEKDELVIFNQSQLNINKQIKSISNNQQILQQFEYLLQREQNSEKKTKKYSFASDTGNNINQIMNIYDEIFERPEQVPENDSLDIKNQTQKYLKLVKGTIKKIDLDPCKFFEKNKFEIPYIYILVISLLHLPASSAEIERSFSKAGLINTDLRNRLSDEMLDILLFLKMNIGNNYIEKSLIEKIYQRDLKKIMKL